MSILLDLLGLIQPMALVPEDTAVQTKRILARFHESCN